MRLSPIFSVCELLTYSTGQVVLTSFVLILLQVIGFFLSLHLLMNNIYAEEDDPWSHVCVEALICLLYLMDLTTTTLVCQMVYGIVAVSVNLLLIYGTMARTPVFLLPWLVIYSVSAVVGNFSLTIIIIVKIALRYTSSRDVMLVHILWSIVPLFLFILYMGFWVRVYRLLRILQREHKALINVKI